MSDRRAVHATPRATTVSAPGKVLVAGGYLVLDPAYTGLVLATSARFYTSVAAHESTSNMPVVRVRSPQFVDAEWSYAVQLSEDMTDSVDFASALRLRVTGRANPFVAFALLYTLHISVELLGIDAFKDVLGGGLDVVIAGDNDYYSHRRDGRAPSLDELRALPPRAALGCTLDEVHKTGLGSSAAMTTSLIAALLLHLGVAECDNHSQLTLAAKGLIHNVAQLAHCAAQGKVGSGFDVSASVWGSQLYRRYDPALIKKLMREEMGRRILAADATSMLPYDKLALLPTLNAHNSLWVPVLPRGTHSVPTAGEGLIELARAQGGDISDIARPAPLQLPPGVLLCLADVDSGSNTRTLVGSVSEWRAKKPEWAAQLYRVIAAANRSVSDGLLNLHIAFSNDSAEYSAVIRALAARPSTEWDAYRTASPSSTADAFIEVRNAIRSVRGGMRELGRLSGAPVEPSEMTRLVDATVAGASGILGAGVPGAGGYDAIYVLYLCPEALEGNPAQYGAPAEVCRVWASWSELSVGPLLCGVDSPGAPTVPARSFLGTVESLDKVLHGLASRHGGLRIEGDVVLHT